MKTWVKLYTEIIDDPDQGTLTWAQRGIWSALLALAGKLDHRNDGHETGQLDTLERIAWHLRCNIEELAEAIAAFIERDMMHERDGILFLTNYGKRQAAIPVVERVRRHRERQRKAEYYGNSDETKEEHPDNDDVTTRYESSNEDVTTRYTEADTDTDTEPDTEAAAAARDDSFGVALQDYENSFGILGSRHQYDLFQIIWDDYPVLEMHDYAREQMRRFADRPNLKYYEQCLATIAVRDYILEEEKDEEEIQGQGRDSPRGGKPPPGCATARAA